MTDPWDIPQPAKGDIFPGATFKWAGRIITEWEWIELELAQLYCLFKKLPRDDSEALREYGGGTIFANRLTALKRCACSYFVSRCDQTIEGEFLRLCRAAEGFAGRRNEVAHSVIFPTRILPIFPKRGIIRRWCLTPPYITLRKYDDKGFAKYAYTSATLQELARRMAAYRTELVQFRLGL